MTVQPRSRRRLTLRLITSALSVSLLGVGKAGSANVGASAVPAGDTSTAPPEALGVSHSSAAIHQEIAFGATAEQLYRALTEAEQFDQVMRFAPARRMAMRAGALPTEISTERGGSFTLFGGYISGRQIELVPNERIVQAWRAASWPQGAYSIVTVAIGQEASTTRLVLDHRGFPDEEAPHLAKGWQLNYWQPLASYVGRGPKRRGITPPHQEAP